MDSRRTGWGIVPNDLNIANVINKFTLLRKKPRLRAVAHFGVQARALACGAPHATDCHCEPFAFCHSEPFACHSERSEESLPSAQGKLREAIP
jgi:hypothetical protein